MAHSALMHATNHVSSYKHLVSGTPMHIIKPFIFTTYHTQLILRRLVYFNLCSMNVYGFVLLLVVYLVYYFPGFVFLRWIVVFNYAVIPPCCFLEGYKCFHLNKALPYLRARGISRVFNGGGNSHGHHLLGGTNDP